MTISDNLFGFIFAKVVSTDTLADVALLKIQRDNCPALELLDPVALSVETYNENLKYIGTVAQFGLGFAPSVEYAIPWLLNKK